MRKLLFCAVLAVVLAGCASTHGRPITQAQIESLVVGQTTDQQALQMFGPPLTDTVNSDGTRVLSWGYARAALGAPVQSQGLSIVFDREGRVMNFSRSNYGQLQ